MKDIRKRQVACIGHVIRRNGLEHLTKRGILKENEAKADKEKITECHHQAEKKDPNKIFHCTWDRDCCRDVIGRSRTAWHWIMMKHCIEYVVH